jgi:hypothetical protein
VGAAYTKAAVTVGVNALLTSGKERGNINASWNVLESKNISGLSQKIETVQIHLAIKGNKSL